MAEPNRPQSRARTLPHTRGDNTLSRVPDTHNFERLEPGGQSKYDGKGLTSSRTLSGGDHGAGKGRPRPRKGQTWHELQRRQGRRTRRRTGAVSLRRNITYE